MSALLCALSLCARADSIQLKNGNTIDGIIMEESDTSIKLDLGVGSMSIRKSRIESISRADANSNLAIKSQWKKEHVLHKRHVPLGLESIAESFKNLEGLRASAAAAANLAAINSAKCHKIEETILEMHKAYLDINRQLQWMEPGKDPAKYNATVATNNTLSTVIKLKQAELERTQEVLDGTSSAMATYLQALTEFNTTFTRASTDKQLLAVDSSYQVFFDEIARRLKPYMGEYKSHNVSAKSDSGSTLVPVMINDSVAAMLLLDTGASTVTISQALADKLKLDLSGSPSVKVTLADGQSVDARRTVLSSLSAGTAKAEGIQTVVLPSQPGKDVDGLLGMSFLGRFKVNFNASTSKLTLEELDLNKK